MIKFLGYEVSKSGEFKSRFGKVISQHKSNAGYMRVELWSNGFERSTAFIGLLLASMWIIQKIKSL